MTIRYFPRYAGKEGFEERYELVDSRTGDVLSPPGPYQDILEQVEARNNPDAADTATHMADLMMLFSASKWP